jgi:hypothetical protein
VVRKLLRNRRAWHCAPVFSYASIARPRFSYSHLILENSEGSHIGFEDISGFHRMPSMTNSAHSLFSKASL